MKLAVVAKAPQTNAVRDLTEPYATELARAAHQITIECVSMWLRDKLARSYKARIT